MTGDPGSSAAERFLSLTGRDPAPVAASKLHAFRRFLLLLSAAESCHVLLSPHYPAYQEQPALHLAIAAWLVAWAFAGQLARFGRIAAVAASFGIAADLVSVFPENANHQYLGLLAMSLVAMAGPDEREAVPVVQALRFIVPIAFFWAGVQKLFWGYWLGGEFLAVRISTDSSFAAVLGPLLSPGEYERLAALVPGRGAGPYRTTEPLLLAVSNGTWLAEIALAPLLLLARSRRLAALGVALFMVAIETAARELFFGLFMISLAALYARGDLLRRCLPLVAAVLAFLLATSAGLLPRWSFG